MEVKRGFNLDKVILIIYIIALFCFILGIIFSRLSFRDCKKIIDEQKIIIEGQNNMLKKIIESYQELKDNIEKNKNA